MTSRQTGVYVGYLEDGTPGYIGIGYDPEARWVRHQAKAWSRHISGWETEAWYDRRVDAKAAESQLIDHFRPPFNVAENEGHHHPIAELALTGAAPRRPRRPRRPSRQEQLAEAIRTGRRWHRRAKRRGLL